MSQRLEVLRRLPPSVASDLVSEALLYADESERFELCRVAVEIGSTDCLVAVLRVAPHLGEEGLELLRRPADLTAAVAAAGPEQDPALLRTVLSLAAARSDPRLLPVVARAVGAADPAVAETAALALLAVVTARLGVTGRQRPGPEEETHLDAALATAAARYRTHRLAPVLLAVAVGSARPGLALSRVFDERDHPTSVALRGLADRTDEPLVRWNLVRWLGNPVTARAAARGFHRLRDASAYAETLVDGHLLLAPRRRRLLRTAARPLQCLPELAEAIKLPFRSQAWLPELVLRLDISARSRVGMLADMIALPSPVARIKCVAALLTQSPDRTAATLETFAHDRAGVVARLAMHGLVGCGRLPDDQLERLEATPHPAIRTRARRTLLARSAASYFTRWLLVPEAVRVAAGRRMLAEERGPFLAGLQRCLAEGGEAGLAAIMLVRRFRLERAVTAALCRAASAGDARLASAAVAALPAAGGDDATRRVEAALEEEVRPRVRANAVEAIARMMAREAVHRLAPWIDNPDNRVRANAIRALRRYDDGRAAPALRRMLDDGDPLHRVSGIWVARTTRDPAIRGRLRTMAMTDPHGEIRTRARRAALLLDAD